MKSLALILIVVLTIVLAGCACEHIPEQEIIAEEPLQPAEAVQEQEPEKVNESPEAIVEEEKQLALGSTDIKEEEATIISDVVCDFEEDQPKKFSFTITNIEEKEWVFEYVSYTDQDEYAHPIVILNALQVTDAQLKDACRKKRLAPDESAVCDFDLGTDIRVSRSLRTGLTPLGSEKTNILSLKTAGHAAELKFICE